MPTSTSLQVLYVKKILISTMVKFLDCDAAISVPNAVSRTPSGSQVGDVAIYECNSGYGLVGNPNVTCEASGFWGTVPECRLGK